MKSFLYMIMYISGVTFMIVDVKCHNCNTEDSESKLQPEKNYYPKNAWKNQIIWEMENF